ncbi:BRO family protein [Thiorhodococcus fuscus]|uniref:BRO family protein n=1 Tax=Thiorhodococcus fuscus TaxID=527200 RepID=A0ABW4Y873_9GAMM
MTALSTFTFPVTAAQVRTVTDENGDPWFVAKDVADALGYENTMEAVRYHCKRAKALNTLKQSKMLSLHPHTKLIPEADIYRLVMRSKLPSAVEFEEWVVEEVLPSIRKTGSYSMQPALPDFTDPAAAAEAWAKEYRDKMVMIDFAKKQAAQLTEQAPLVDFAEAVVADSEDCYIRDAAKTVDVAPFRLYEILRQYKWIPESDVYRMVMRSTLSAASRSLSWWALVTTRSSKASSASQTVVLSLNLQWRMRPTKTDPAAPSSPSSSSSPVSKAGWTPSRWSPSGCPHRASHLHAGYRRSSKPPVWWVWTSRVDAAEAQNL